MADPLPRGGGGRHDPADPTEAAAGKSTRLQCLTKPSKTKGQLDLESDVSHVPWKCSRGGPRPAGGQNGNNNNTNKKNPSVQPKTLQRQGAPVYSATAPVDGDRSQCELGGNSACWIDFKSYVFHKDFSDIVKSS